MPVRLGARADRLTNVRKLLTPKARRERHHFLFEGPTLLQEAHRSGTAIDELYVTQAAYDASPLVRELDAGGTPTFLIDDRSLAKLSDVETPTGIVAVSPTRLEPLTQTVGGEGVVLVLADISDPANAGSLLRSADAFGAAGVVFGDAGVDPYHPKVVRAAMGALFRLRLSRAGPDEFAAAADAVGLSVVGLAAGAPPIDTAGWPSRSALVVGHERLGLERWSKACDRLLGIPIDPQAESLNAAIAGSIALYEAAGRGRREPPEPACQESVLE
jgi:TrmH family RNA methyltransferase